MCVFSDPTWAKEQNANDATATPCVWDEMRQNYKVAWMSSADNQFNKKYPIKSDI